MKLFLACLTLVSSSALVQARGKKDGGKKDGDYGKKEKAQAQSMEPYKIALWGDLPYRGETVNVFENGEEDIYGDVYSTMRDAINSYDLAFNIHSGDVKGGGASCGELSYKRFEDLINAFDNPGILTLGDNEWVDCHRLSNGNYDPLERLEYIRHRFYDGERTLFGSKYAGNIHTSIYSKAYPEMQLWTYNNVMYVAIHVTGTNNAFYDGVDATCSTYHDIIDPGCEHANAEFRERNHVGIDFMKHAFEIAHEYDMAGVMVAIQANFFRCEGDCIDSSTPVRILTGMQDFWHALVEEANDFEKPVVLFHGDRHFYSVYPNPGGLADNLVAVQCPGSGDIGWVLCEVDPTSDHVFSFTHIDHTPDEA